jgi:hypothetical protein
MRISELHLDQCSLENFGREAVILLGKGNFAALTERFGYALAHGRDPAEAIEEDLASSLLEHAAIAEQLAPSITIKYFQADVIQNVGLVAAVECITHMAGGIPVLLALVVSATASGRCITLESIDRV